jgi:hypothetical protein
MKKGDGRPSPFCDLIRNADSLSLPAAAKPTVILVVNFLLVVDVTASSANRRANRRAFSAADQRASQRAYASASRRAPDRFAGRVLAVIIATEAITSEIVVEPGRVKATPAARPVLRHRARSGGGG